MRPSHPVPGPFALTGRVEARLHESRALEGNGLGDPCVREVPVWLPPDAGRGGERLPVVFLLAGFTGRGQSMLDTHPWKHGPVLAYDRAVSAGEAPRALLVLPDAFTRYGGSQYVDSSLVGRYEQYVARELVEFVDAHYPTLPGRRAVVGKSSGGFGALWLGMRHPDTFPVVASIAGDCHFEYGYASDFLPALRGLLPYRGDVRRFLDDFERDHDLSGDRHAVLNLIAMSACYSPSPTEALGFELPIDLHTGARVERVWERWLEFDPVVACTRYAEPLRRLERLHLEAGLRDEFHLQFALRVFANRLRELGVPFEHVEFDGGHFGLDRRLGALLPRLIRTLI